MGAQTPHTPHGCQVWDPLPHMHGGLGPQPSWRPARNYPEPPPPRSWQPRHMRGSRHLIPLMAARFGTPRVTNTAQRQSRPKQGSPRARVERCRVRQGPGASEARVVWSCRNRLAQGQSRPYWSGPSRPGGGRVSDGSGNLVEQIAKGLKPLRAWRVVGPPPPHLAVHQTGIDQLLHVVRQRRLTDPEDARKMTRAHARATAVGNVLEDAQPNGIAQGLGDNGHGERLRGRHGRGFHASRRIRDCWRISTHRVVRRSWLVQRITGQIHGASLPCRLTLIDM